MSHRIIDVSRQYPYISPITEHVLVVPHNFPTIANAIEKAQVNSTIHVYPGIYSEPLQVPDKVHIEGIGYDVVITGTSSFNGSGACKNVKLVSVITSPGSNRSFKDTQISGSLKCVESTVRLENSYVNGGIIDLGGNITLRFVVISGPYSLDLNNSICTAENSTFENSVTLQGSTVLDCRQTTIIDSNRDLIQTLNDTVTVQLFNCFAMGQALIKSGPGNSVRSNLISLGEARELVGGSNIQLGSV